MSCARFGSVVPTRKAPLTNEEARNKPVAASTELDATSYHAGKASDDILSMQDKENFWASANHRDVGAWWQKNLGRDTFIEKVEVQFRGFGSVTVRTVPSRSQDRTNSESSTVSASSFAPAIFQNS